MYRKTRKSLLAVSLLTALLSAPALGGSVNKSIKIDAGEEASGATSVNGSITIGENAVVSGDVNTVNGSIRVAGGASITDASTVNGGVKLADNVSANDLSTVNGTIRVGETSTIDGQVEAVNGKIMVGAGSTVARDVSNVNGRIALSGAQVGGDVSTVSGDIELEDKAIVKGDLIVEKPSNWGWRNKNKRKPRVVIGPGSVVEGKIRLEREVDLYISDSATVGGVEGAMTLDDAIRFSGTRP